MADAEKKENYTERETKEMCKHLYCDNVGWETAEGWDDIIKDFSVKCEELNLRFYRKYRLKIYAEQIKQKWGELRIYCSITQDPGVFMTFARSLLKKVTETLFKVNYGYKQVIDEHTHKNHYIKVFKDEEGRKKAGGALASNVKDYKWFGRFVRVTDYDVFGSHHMEATKHKLLRKILDKLYHWKTSLGNDQYDPSKASKETSVIREYMDSMLDQYTTEAENKAAHTCESCGRNLVAESDKCWTKGWVRLLCKSCATRGKSRYYCDGKLYEGETLIEEKKEEDED